MLDTIKHITVGEKEYPIAFTLNVMEKVQEQYGSMEKWSERLEPKEKLIDEKTGRTIFDKETGEAMYKAAEPNIKDLIWTFKEFVNEGIDIENEEKGEDRSFITHKQAGRLISNIKEAGKTLMDFTAKSVSTGKEDPNEITRQNQKE